MVQPRMLLSPFLHVIAAAFLALHANAELVPDNPVTPDWNINLVDMHPCEGTESQLLGFEDYSIFKAGRTKYNVNGTFVFHRTIEKSPEKSWDIHVEAEWQDGENTQTKRTMAVLDLKNTCMDLEREDSNWAGLFDSIADPIERHCPLKKGKYTAFNYGIDLDNAKGILQEGTWYLYFNHTYDGLFSCHLSEVLVTVSRS